MSNATYLKKHTEALVKDVGIEAACALTGKSKATLGRYYSDSEEHDDRFMPIDVVAQLEAEAKFPHVTAALADLNALQCLMTRKSATRRHPGSIRMWSPWRSGLRY